MKVKAKIMTSSKFQIDGKSFVKIQGFLDGLGLFSQTVKEELVPDSLEGKSCEMDFTIGLSQFKPYLKLSSINILNN